MSALSTQTDWATRFERFVAEDAEVRLVTRYSDFRALLEVGAQRYLLTVTGGEVTLRPNPTIRGTSPSILSEISSGSDSQMP